MTKSATVICGIEALDTLVYSTLEDGDPVTCALVVEFFTVNASRI